MQGSKPCVLPISPRPNIGCSGGIWTRISRLMRPLSYQYSTLQYGAEWWGRTTRVLRHLIYSQTRSSLRYNSAYLVGKVGLAPTRHLPRDFKSLVSTNFHHNPIRGHNLVCAITFASSLSLSARSGFRVLLNGKRGPSSRCDISPTLTRIVHSLRSCAPFL